MSLLLTVDHVRIKLGFRYDIKNLLRGEWIRQAIVCLMLLAHHLRLADELGVLESLGDSDCCCTVLAGFIVVVTVIVGSILQVGCLYVKISESVLPDFFFFFNLLVFRSWTVFYGS